MSAISIKELKKRVELEGATAVSQHLVEALKSGDLHYNDMPTLRPLAECLITRKENDKQSCGSHYLSESYTGSLTEEAASYVSSDAFANINGQIFYNAFIGKYQSADYSLSPKFGTVNSQLLRGERVPGISNIQTVLNPVPEGNELPHIAPSEDFLDTTAQLRRGCIVSVTDAAIMQDKTAELVDRCEQLGTVAGLQGEIEACKCLVDADTRTEYKWKGTLYATYQSSTPWANIVTSNALVNATNVNNSVVKMAGILDPFTGYPINIPGPMYLVATPALKFTAARIKNATQLRTGTSSSSDTITITEGEYVSPEDFEIINNKYLVKVLSDAGLPSTNWYYGNVSEAFKWFVGMPPTVSEALPNAGYMFTRSIARSFKVEMWRTAQTVQPRYMVVNQA